jgi:hypothetical protein
MEARYHERKRKNYRTFEEGKGGLGAVSALFGRICGKLKGYTAREILQDKDKLVESLLEVKKI